jgi:hypothetical protein
MACIFWLKNRKPQEWRDRAELQVDQDEALVAVSPGVLEGQSWKASLTGCIRTRECRATARVGSGPEII